MQYTQHTVTRIASLTLTALLFCTACGDEKRTDTAARDVALMRDSAESLTLSDTALAAASVVPAEEQPAAATPSPAAEAIPAPPAPGRVAKPAPVRATAPSTPSRGKTPRPAAQTPAPAPAAPARAAGIVAAGTTIRVTSGAKVCSSTLQVGDRVSVTTTSATAGSNGLAIPAGARVGLVVTRSKTSASQGDPAELAFDVRSVSFGDETYTVVGDVTTDAVVTERKGGDGKKIAVGAAAGAVIGNIIGGGSRAQRTVVGAAAGGAAGAVTAAMTGDRYACLPEGAALTIRLGSPLEIRN